MRFALLAICLLFSFAVNAGTVTTLGEFAMLPQERQCKNLAWVYTRGIEFRNDGNPMQIKNGTQEQLAARLAGKWQPPQSPDPEAGSYIYGWDKFDDALRAVITRQHNKGWRFADEFIAQHGQRVSHDAIEHLGALELKRCLQEQDTFIRASVLNTRRAHGS